MTYQQAINLAFENVELLENFDRLYGTNLLGKGSPIDRMIDKNSGRLESDFKNFVDFFNEHIWSVVTSDPKNVEKPEDDPQ